MSEENAEIYDEGDERVVFSQLFVLKKTLGQGAFGTVVSVVQRSDLKEYAVKIVQKTVIDRSQYDLLIKEAAIHQQLSHPNIVKFSRVIESETRIFLVMELIGGGQLQEFIEERKKIGRAITDVETAAIMRGIFSALQYVHSKDIVHRDLKPQNILFADKNDLESIKIIDFGLAAQYDPSQSLASFNARCGTKIFMAPELWQRKQYSKPVDMWSCGVIMYMILSGGKHPIYEPNDSEEVYLQKLERGEWAFPSTFNRYSKDIFLKLISDDPFARYTVEQMQNHPWITRRFNEDVPLTSPEKMRAFSHSQTLSNILKSIYLIHKLPGAKAEIDPIHKLKIRETSERHEALSRKNSSFVDSFRILFDTINSDNNDPTLTTAATNGNYERTLSSLSPSSAHGINSQNSSPKYPVLGSINSQKLVPIPENTFQKDVESTPSRDTEERLRFTDQSICNEDFTLPEAQIQNLDSTSKKLQFTISVQPVPVRRESSGQIISRHRNSSPQKNLERQISAVEETETSNFSIRKIRTLDVDDKEAIRRLKSQTNTMSIAMPSTSSSPSHKSTNPVALKSSNTKRRISIKNNIDFESLEQLRNKKEERLNQVTGDSRARNLDSPIPRESNSPNNQASPDPEPKSPLKGKSPFIKKVPSLNVKLLSDDTRLKELKNLKLPSINQDNRGRASLLPKKNETETVSKVSNIQRASFSPIKTTKDWLPSKEAKKNLFSPEKISSKDPSTNVPDSQYGQQMNRKNYQQTIVNS